MKKKLFERENRKLNMKNGGLAAYNNAQAPGGGGRSMINRNGSTISDDGQKQGKTPCKE